MFETLMPHKQLIKGVLFSRAILPIISLLLSNGINTKTLEISRNIYYHRLVSRVTKRIKSARISPLPVSLDLNRDNLETDAADSQKRNVWLYWDSGFENAPEIVKICTNKLKSYSGVNLIFLDNTNLGKYVQIPDHINRKFSTGKISKAHFSDLLRVELLYVYGGIWLDATVFLSGDEFPPELLGDDLFFYSMSKPSINGNPIYLSSWAITSPPRHPIISITRAYLFDYWEKNNKLMDYFLLHIALCASINSFSEYRPNFLGFYNNAGPHLMLLNYDTPFTEELFEKIQSISDIHKLSNKYENVKERSVLDFLLRSDVEKNRLGLPHF